MEEFAVLDLLIQDAICYFSFVQREEPMGNGQPQLRPTG